ncbi:hypothetical protein M407DRAFT_240669 [Tulasnella calospora MUT 4182]|uniref:Protein-lysine N-methyltransferase EFM4 n=1 Tax=Tulasnella calospora MUT 4182 TaxID=1051891 RepID=A0A0C3QYL3_9AGAM|nr:hypothetical protein M407DRAFT_240669 [Tulasnella calospora MUT 4182]
MADEDDPQTFEPSKLGTKQHWDDVYKRELANFEDDSEDEGEVWFGLDSVEKMVDWATENVPSSSKPYTLDIGSGNGTLSLALAGAGYPVDRILGVDYSEDSVRLARSVARHRSVPGLRFEASDFLSEDPPQLEGMDSSAGGWDLLLDKGTFDAIALADKTNDGSAPIDGYPTRISRLLKSGAYFLITSCNFTEEELKQRFSAPAIGLVYHSRIQHPTFTFGGKTGSTCSSVAFKKQ